MAILTFVPVTKPDDNMTVELKEEVLESNFGEYVQRASPGINSKKWDISPQWTNLYAWEATSILAFLKTQSRTTPFYYTAPEEPQRLYYLEKLAYKWKRGRRCDISCDFKHTVLP